MTIRTDLPQAFNFAKPEGYQAEPPADVMANWAQKVLAAEGDSETEIAIYDIIGEDFWSGGGWTAARMKRALAKATGRDVTVKINSPGGDVFEGLAIYNELRGYKGKVNVQVMGLAASAASIVAMAADEITMGLGTFLMIHKAWGYVVGNEDDFRAAGDLFAKFDGALSDIYVARTKKPAAEVAALMRAETWMAPQEAVALGFADKVDEALKGEPAPNTTENRALAARRQTEAALAKAGHSRTSRAALLGDLGAAPRDASRQTNEAPLDASLDLTALAAFAAEMKGFATKLRS
jgi:ATP-dependent protease ClpP protease subunit